MNTEHPTPNTEHRKAESLLARRARELREARAAAGKAPAVMPRTKLKRRPVKVVPEAPLLILSKDLSHHPLLQRVAMLPDLIDRETKLGAAQGKSRAAHKAAAEEMTHDFEALVSSVRHHGLRDKLKVVKGPKGYLVVDGRHRLEVVRTIMHRYGSSHCARALAFREKGIPCELVSEAEVSSIIQDAVTRRHMSKGARAYLAVLMQPEVATEADKRKKATQFGHGHGPALNAEPDKPSALSAEGLAKKAGVSPRLIDDAIALYRLFEDRKDLRKKFEDAIWVGAGLAKLRAGIDGYLATGTDPDEEPESADAAEKRIALKRFDEARSRWIEVKTSLKHWEKLTPEHRAELITYAAECLAEGPEDFRAGLARELAAGDETED